MRSYLLSLVDNRILYLFTIFQFALPGEYLLFSVTTSYTNRPESVSISPVPLKGLGHDKEY
jgi:hypothetical protein